MNTRTIRVAGLLLVLALAVYYKFGYQGGLENELNAHYADLAQKQSERVAALEGKPVTGLPVEYHNYPESSWRNSESRRAARYLGQVNSTLLVLPVQGDVNAFDPVERSLITRLLVANLNQQDALYAADAGKVLQFFGTHRTSFSPPEIQELAAITGAQFILEVQAEHNLADRFSITATLKSVSGSQSDKQRVWDDLRFSDELMPSEAFVEIIPDVAKFSTGKRSKQARVDVTFDHGEFIFPESFEELVSMTAKSPMHAAAYLQMLGMLHPRGGFNETRDYLFERSLVELQKVSTTAPFYRYFKARAYAYLDRRPAAVALSEEPLNRFEQALLDALNGNLPNLQAFFVSDETSILQFMALKDLQEISYWYSADVDQEFLEKFTQDHANWAPLLYRSLRDHELWADYSAATLKFALDTMLPAKSESLEDFFQRQSIVGAVPDELELTRLLWQHLEEIENTTARVRGRNLGALPTISELDIVDLVRTLAVANHLREVEEDLTRRVLPGAALDELNRFESFYSGHPEVTLLKARALSAMSGKSSGAEIVNLRAAAAEAEVNGFVWTGRITPDAAAVARRFSSVFKTRPQTRPGTYNPFKGYSRRYFEWPKSSGWYRRIPKAEAEDGGLDRCINYMWTSFQCLRWKIDAKIEGADNPDEIRSALLAQYADRYLGHPKRDEYQVEMARSDDGGDAEVRTIRSLIEAGSADQSLYYALGRIYKRRGDYERAQQTWLSYPGFHSDDVALKLSEVSQANNAASMLFWIGQYELAMPLLEIAASSPAGSESSMTSAARIALVNGDLETAATWSAHRVRRYNSKYALRDFLQLLHIIGDSDTAWSTFDQFIAVQQHSQMWSGALVGHRLQSTSIDEISAWIQASDSLRRQTIRETSRRERINPAARYLLLAGTMDRVPETNLANMVAAANGQSKPVVQHQGMPARTSNDSTEQVQFSIVKDGSAIFRHDDNVPTPRNPQRAANNQEIEHRYTMLARAMTEFLNGNFDAAFNQFNETAYFYYLDEYLPYYAYSASVTGQAGHIQELLAGREKNFAEVLKKESLGTSDLGYRFDEDLTYAVLAGLSGDHDSAMYRLRLALNNRPYLEDRSVYPMYQVVDLAERLFEKTGEDVYKEFALDLSRRHTVVLPMYSWAYFVIAKYSQSEIERVSAAASGIHLDSLSHRASELDVQLIENARELLKQSGPPYLKSGGSTRTEAT